jgi:vacuolar protein sorting-associated protein 54
MLIMSPDLTCLQEIDWETSSSRSGANEYAEMLVKETTTLHKVLSKYLAVPTVEVSFAFR